MESAMSENFFIPDSLIINGGNPISGDIKISGAKNSILGLMAAALLTDDVVTLRNVPYITDVLEMGHIMRDIGVDVEFNPQKRILKLHAAKIVKNEISHQAAHFRASYYLWGSLLARFCRTKEFDSLKVCLPGGCSFGGKRPTDFHEELIKTVFGATISLETRENEKYSYLNFQLPKNENPDLCPVYTTFKASHGATFHWLLSVSGSDYSKMMYNASLEPEVSNLIAMLQKMGLGLIGSERTGIIYDGKNRKLLKGVDFEVIPDRLEAATYALLTLSTRGAVELDGIKLEHCSPWLGQLERMFSRGIYYSTDKKKVYLDFRKIKPYDGFIMQVTPFPGFETDLHQIWTPVLAQAKTESIISDLIWAGRSAHLKQMENFGLRSKFYQFDVNSGQQGSIKNLYINIEPSELHAAEAEGTDLRGTMATIMLAATVSGKSKINNPSFALRGYPNLLKNLQDLGVDIQSSKEGREILALPEI